MRGAATRADQCRFCRSCRCYTRIVAIGFDEVACRDHAAALDLYADAELPPGWPREMIRSTVALRRGPVDLDARRTADRSPVEIVERPARTVVPALSREERDALRHALGIDRGLDGRDRHGRRNYYAADAGDPVWAGLAARGLARPARAPSPDMPYVTYVVTREGMVLVGAILDDGWRR